MASHSSCRAISDHPRNMSDDMIQALARKGGVIQINYHVTFLSQEMNDAKAAGGKKIDATDDAIRKLCGENDACVTRESERRDREDMEKGTLPRVSWEKIVEHIDHVVKLVGPDHVGLGSDFDGASMPLGLDDVSKLPRITEALLDKGYRPGDVEKILGGNLLRVMEAAEAVARSSSR
jgi:membrane dipeptidase